MTESPVPRPVRYKTLAAIVAAAIMSALIWASDRITPEGERVLYTVRCAQGAWNGKHCTGKLSAGERYVFRSSIRRREVIFWIRESSIPSLTYTECAVSNRDNWTCNIARPDKPAAKLQMLRGRPSCTGDAAAQPLHAVSKWKWWVLRSGVPLFSDAGKIVESTVASCGR